MGIRSTAPSDEIVLSAPPYKGIICYYFPGPESKVYVEFRREDWIEEMKDELEK